VRPRPDWGPRLKENRTGRYYGDSYGYESDEMAGVVPNVYVVETNIHSPENGYKL
jgi:hypothetical protein